MLEVVLSDQDFAKVEKTSIWTPRRSARHEHGPTAYVFGNGIGEHVKDPKKVWAKCRAAAGISDLKFHDLRHEAASRLLEAGWPSCALGFSWTLDCERVLAGGVSR